MSIKSKGKTAYDQLNIDQLRIGIVTSKWNSAITEILRNGCIDSLKSFGLKEDQIISIEVPGSFELPFGAKLLHKRKQLDAIICLGCVIKGETEHDIFINQAIAQSIQSLSLFIDKPVVFGVLTVNTEEQAFERAGGQHGHKGIESAETALDLLMLDQELSLKKQNIGFNAN